VVCSLEREPIPGKLRYDGCAYLFPRARVVHLTDELPQTKEDPDFWNSGARRFIGVAVFNRISCLLRRIIGARLAGAGGKSL